MRAFDRFWRSGVGGNEPLQQGLRFTLLTGLSAILILGLPIFFHEALRVDEEIAVAISMIVTLVTNFIGMRIFVFRSQGHLLSQGLRFGAYSAMFRLFEYLCFLALFSWGGLHYVLALGIVLVSAFVMKFFVHRALTFKW